MTSILSFLNQCLPFATAGTPLIQDILHLTALCVFLYFAPQIQEKLQTSWLKRANPGRPGTANQNSVVDDAPGHDIRAQAETANARPNNGEQPEQANLQDGPAQGFQAELNVAAEEGQPGPARAPELPPQRNVGAKKAKSLARKDQRRAYNEFMRSQGDAQRARDAEGAEERESVLAAERERRRIAERELESRKAKEREVRRAQEERAREETARRTGLVLSIVREELESQKVCNLFQVAKLVGDDVDEEWVEKVLKASGIMGKQGDTSTIITETGWIARIAAEDMAAVYQTALEENLGDEHGLITNEQLAVILGKVLKQR